MRSPLRKITILIFLSLGAIALFLFYKLGNSWEFALESRGIKLATMGIVSACVAYSTIAFQTITNNRILTPSIMGFESVYMLFQTILVFVYGDETFKAITGVENFLLSTLLMMGFALLLYLFIYKKGVSNMYLLLLIGLVLGMVFNTLSSFMQLLIDPNNFFIVQGKMFASFNKINDSLLFYAFGALLLTLTVGMRFSNRLDVLSLGKTHAINLGLNYHKTVQIILLIVAVMVSISTALVGPVLFLGLLVSNLTYEILKTYRHALLIPACTLVTFIILVGGQFFAERLLQLSTPISIIINFIGGLYFMYLLLKRQRK